MNVGIVDQWRDYIVNQNFDESIQEPYIKMGREVFNYYKKNYIPMKNWFKSWKHKLHPDTDRRILLCNQIMGDHFVDFYMANRTNGSFSIPADQLSTLQQNIDELKAEKAERVKKSLRLREVISTLRREKKARIGKNRKEYPVEVPKKAKKPKSENVKKFSNQSTFSSEMIDEVNRLKSKGLTNSQVAKLVNLYPAYISAILLGYQSYSAYRNRNKNSK